LYVAGLHAESAAIKLLLYPLKAIGSDTDLMPGFALASGISGSMGAAIDSQYGCGGLQLVGFAVSNILAG